MPKIGVARGLHCYHHFPLWRTFFEELGFEVVLSRPTDKEVVVRGVELAPAELCLPVKVFLGHIADLKERVDAIFLPRLVCRCLEGDFYFGCPKAIALPDLVRALFPLKSRFIEIVLDQRVIDDEQAFVRGVIALGVKESAAHRAWKEARKAETGSIASMMYGARYGDKIKTKKERGVVQDRHRIALIGHPYLIYDEHISLNILNLIEELSVEPVLPSVDEKELITEARRASAPNWFYELELIAGARKLLSDNSISGMLLIGSFACGTAPIVYEIIRREVAQKVNLPVLTVLFDEHSAETGLRTRLESFIDLVRIRARWK
ncbi:MAG: acyl-CoA dehydratase activase-related protein [bacterium]